MTFQNSRRSLKWREQQLTNITLYTSHTLFFLFLFDLKTDGRSETVHKAIPSLRAKDLRKSCEEKRWCQTIGKIRPYILFLISPPPHPYFKRQRQQKKKKVRSVLWWDDCPVVNKDERGATGTPKRCPKMSSSSYWYRQKRLFFRLCKWPAYVESLIRRPKMKEEMCVRVFYFEGGLLKTGTCFLRWRLVAKAAGTHSCMRDAWICVCVRQIVVPCCLSTRTPRTCSRTIVAFKKKKATHQISSSPSARTVGKKTDEDRREGEMRRTKEKVYPLHTYEMISHHLKSNTNSATMVDSLATNNKKKKKKSLPPFF